MRLRVVALLHAQLLVELNNIVGQLVHIVRAGDESSHRLVVPESTICSMACGQDGSAVLYGNTIHLGLEVGGSA